MAKCLNIILKLNIFSTPTSTGVPASSCGHGPDRVPRNAVRETYNSCGTDYYRGISFFFSFNHFLSPLASAIYSARLKRPPYEMPDDKIRADSDDDNTNTAARTTILTRSSNGHLYRYCTAGARDKALSCPDTR